ncbi:uncharacterized protein LOC128680609 isoform X2 [Plodia interpunctella]|uniref:uncharacterized protein LOC128680609 isoform X2 n=1 Tax=Plodia interpunctella TaxID=58824 RepID=UPI00236899C7|nr:uncharacterized protein LOC128680609 isoform X2 [Plodia interpunctella]
MCEIFPEVNNCCFVISLRLGCLYIAVLTIMSGVISLSTLERVSQANYEQFIMAQQVDSPMKVLDNVLFLNILGLTAIAMIFIVMGYILIFAIITSQEGFIQLFVWIIFLATMIGFLIVILTGAECVAKSKCALYPLDWLSGSAVLVLMSSFFALWIYFICVANTVVIYSF